MEPTYYPENIWNLIDKFHNDMVNHIGNYPTTFGLVGDTSRDYPRTNIYASDDQTLMYLELSVPGFSKDELNVELQGDTLIVSGNKNQGKVNYKHKGIAQRKFMRKWRVPDGYEVEKLEAHLSQGILTISIPLKFEPKLTKNFEITED